MNTRYAASDNVIARTIGDETVLLNIETEAYFGLNEVGSVVWDTLSKGALDAQSIVSVVIENFEVDQALAAKDVDALLTALLEQGLVQSQV
jgi:Coenzyme PQQ synthesis protein D (PqqD)